MISYLVSFCQIVLASTLLLAANGKTLRPTEFIDAMRLSYLPEVAVPTLAIGIPIVELLLAFGLLLLPFIDLPIAFGMTCLLLVIFTIWMVYVSIRKMHIRCGCFGTASSTIGISSIIRNVALLGCGLLGLSASLIAPSILPGFSFEKIIIVVSLELCLVLVQSFYNARSFLLLTGKDMLQATDDALPQVN